MGLVIFLMTYDLLAGRPKSMGRTVAAFSTCVLYLPLLAVPGIADGLWDPNGSGRFVGLGDDQPNSMARLFQTAALLAFALAVSGRPGFLRRAFWAAVSLAACLMLVETQSRGCEIGTLLPLVYYALAPPRGALRRSTRRRFRARIAAAAVLGAAVLAVALSTTLQATLYERWLPPAVRKLGIQISPYDLVLLNTQIGSRAVDMRYFLPVAERHPWGVGLGLEDKYLAPVWPEGDGPNSALDLPLYGGVGAVLTFLILVATAARYLWRICGRAPRGGPSLGYAQAASLALAGRLIAWPMMGTPIGDATVWALAGMALAAASTVEGTARAAKPRARRLMRRPGESPVAPPGSGEPEQ
ncbi:MAG TPA: hypothetical protein VKV28_12850 [Candidatus Binataceae bacterium]|nr:hypothetical protein [Candidatus Binataceae bacterium]